MAKYPSEIFGFAHTNHDEEATRIRAKHWCPFVDKPCYKQSRLIDYPFGVCAAHVNGEEIALCPRRFLDRHIVFSDIALRHFQTTSDILVFPEVRLEDIGSFDFVMVKHRPLSTEIEDFAVIEFQTGQTTGTGQLVQGLQDFMAGKRFAYESYAFGLNLYDIWKRTFTQILNKGVILENWGRKIYWVVQEPVYRYFETRYNLQTLGMDTRHSTVFSLYDLRTTGGSSRHELVATRHISASMDQLFASFRNNPNIPSVNSFLKGLRNKIESEAHISLHLERPARSATVDVRRPTATGRVREHSDDEQQPDSSETLL